MLGTAKMAMDRLIPTLVQLRKPLRPNHRAAVAVLALMAVATREVEVAVAVVEVTIIIIIIIMAVGITTAVAVVVTEVAITETFSQKMHSLTEANSYSLLTN